MSEVVLTIDVLLDDFLEVKGTAGTALMILFHGKSEGKYFNGEILPGGVDTQKEPAGAARILSARYILEGTDCEGEKCRIFVENNGEITDPQSGGNVETKPLIYTDSQALKWLESADLYGTVEPAEGGVKIKIYKR
jgi:hypothetical protein